MTETKVIRIDEEVLMIIRQYSDGSVSDGVRAMQRQIEENTERLMTPEEVTATVRIVCQTEGVRLHRDERAVFRELFGNLINVIRGERE